MAQASQLRVGLAVCTSSLGERMSQIARYLRRMWRAALTTESLVSAEEAVEALPAPGPDAQAWLLANVEPFGDLAGVEVYRWGDIVAALRERASPSEPTTTWISTDEAAARLGVSRRTLDEMLARAPKSLPGSPAQVGGGRERRHLRWDAGRLDEWMASYQDWRQRRGRRSKSAAPAQATRPSTTHGRRSVLAIVSSDE